MNSDELQEQIKELSYIIERVCHKHVITIQPPGVKNSFFFDFKERMKASAGVKYSEYVKRSKVSSVMDSVVISDGASVEKEPN